MLQIKRCIKNREVFNISKIMKRMLFFRSLDKEIKY